MAGESRVKKSLLNAKVNLICYFVSLFVAFFTRKIFLDHLGADFIGLVGTLQNILGILNLAELGIGAAVGFNLYKPLQQRDTQEVTRITSLYGYYYRNIGLLILGVAVIVSCFLPLIFNKTDFSYGIIYFAFYSFLASSLIGYFINYRQIVLGADQRNYVVSGYLQIGTTLKCILQMVLICKFANYYLWVAIELCFGILYAIILNVKINKTYPWLKCSWKLGKAEQGRYPNILQSTKQIFIHRIKDFLLQGSDQIFVYAFVSLKMVAYYGNYVLITSKVTALIQTILDSVTAGVGNLVAEGNKSRILAVFWELMFIRYLVAGVIVFAIGTLISPFITFWLGAEYLLDPTVLILLLITIFISLSRGAVDSFNYAYGHYADVWSAWAEGAINVTVTLIAGHFWGINGILMGKICSTIPIIVIWKPMYLFRDGFHESYLKYWLGTVRYYVAFILSAVFAALLCRMIPIDPYQSLIDWVGYATCVTLLFLLIYATLLILIAPGAKNALRRLPLNKIGISI